MRPCGKRSREQVNWEQCLPGDTVIGQIEDVLVDLDHSSLIAVILSVGGFLGVGDKLVAVSSQSDQSGHGSQIHH